MITGPPPVKEGLGTTTNEDGSISELIAVSKHLVGKLIGKAGTTIQQLQASTATNIQIDQVRRQHLVVATRLQQQHCCCHEGCNAALLLVHFSDSNPSCCNAHANCSSRTGCNCKQLHDQAETCAAFRSAALKHHVLCLSPDVSELLHLHSPCLATFDPSL